ncbi:PLDc N-terminal domain-containing protein [Aliidiomarina sp. Khilg15.8]
MVDIGGFGGILGLIWLIIIIYAIVKTLQSSADTGTKVLWVVLLLVIPLIGFILWLFLGPKGGASTL